MDQNGSKSEKLVLKDKFYGILSNLSIIHLKICSAQSMSEIFEILKWKKSPKFHFGRLYRHNICNKPRHLMLESPENYLQLCKEFWIGPYKLYSHHFIFKWIGNAISLGVFLVSLWWSLNTAHWWIERIMDKSSGSWLEVPGAPSKSLHSIIKIRNFYPIKLIFRQ